jgi:hypothetical protein
MIYRLRAGFRVTFFMIYSFGHILSWGREWTFCTTFTNSPYSTSHKYQLYQIVWIRTWHCKWNSWSSLHQQHFAYLSSHHLSFNLFHLETLHNCTIIPTKVHINFPDTICKTSSAILSWICKYLSQGFTRICKCFVILPPIEILENSCGSGFFK